jgi:hypothetical protein
MIVVCVPSGDSCENQTLRGLWFLDVDPVSTQWHDIWKYLRL